MDYHPSWKNVFQKIPTNLLIDVMDKVHQERETYEPDIMILPPPGLVFRIFQVPLDKIRVVLIGQDPYIHRGEAMGYSFSVPIGTKTPPSLQNIFKELENDLGIKRTRTDLSDWVEQGVFCINQALTVRENKSNSHQNYWRIWMTEFWKIFWQELRQPVAIWCWGKDAERAIRDLPDEHPHLVHRSVHPSPLSAYRGFFGSKPFSQTRDYLLQVYPNENAIQW